MTPDVPEDSDSPRVRVVRIVAIAIILIGGSCLLFAVAQPLLELIVAILFGWIRYLALVLPDVSVSSSMLISGVVWVALFTIGSHLFCRWLWREMRADPQARWKRRWTASGVGVILLAFVAGTAAAGLVHQAVFLTRAPIYEYYTVSRYRKDPGTLEERVRDLWYSLDRDPSLSPRSRMSMEINQGAFNDLLQVAIFRDPNGKVMGLILLDRDPEKQRESGFAICGPGGRAMQFPMDQLREKVDELRRATTQPQSTP